MGPGSAAADIRREGTEALCAIMGDVIGFGMPIFGGGPIGAAGTNPRPNPGSNGGAGPKPRGRAEGPREGADICGIYGAKPDIPGGAGGNGDRGGIAAAGGGLAAD